MGGGLTKEQEQAKCKSYSLDTCEIDHGKYCAIVHYPDGHGDYTEKCEIYKEQTGVMGPMGRSLSSLESGAVRAATDNRWDGYDE